MNEIWIQSLDYPKYEVSNWGRVRNKKSGKVLKIRKNKQGYSIVSVKNAWTTAPRYVARLVMLTHTTNPVKSYEVIKYLDGNRSNCRLDNLRYQTFSERTRKTWQTGGYKNVKFYRFPKGEANPKHHSHRVRA